MKLVLKANRVGETAVSPHSVVSALDSSANASNKARQLGFNAERQRGKVWLLGNGSGHVRMAGLYANRQPPTLKSA